MQKLVFYLIALSLCGCRTIPDDNNPQPTVRKDNNIPTTEEVLPIPLIDYLFEIGGKLGCYFTLEYQDHPITGKTAKLFDVVSNDLNIASMTALMARLRHDVPGYSVTENAKNPKIVHIIDRGLEGKNDYVLNQRVTLRYSGNLVACVVKDAQGRNIVKGQGLVTAIGKKLGGIQSGPPSQDGRDAFDDCVTQVEVNRKDQSVRSILTDCIPVQNYKPVLWRAVTTKKDGQTNVLVQFYGPRE